MTKRKKQTRQPVEPVAIRSLLRTLGIIFAIDVALLLLGIAFFVIAAGVQLIIRSSAPYWLPAHRLMDFLLGSPPSATLALSSIHGRAVVRLIALITLAVLMILFGIFLLARGGLCAQNLFCAGNV